MIYHNSLLKIFKESPDPIIILSPNVPHFNIIDVNNSFIKVSGKTEKDLIGEKFIECFCLNGGYESGNNDLIKSLKIAAENKITNEIYDQHIGFLNSNSNNDISKLYNVKTVPVLSEEGDAEIIVCYLTSTKADEEKYIMVQKIARLGHWQLDLKSKKLFWSDEVYNIFGVTKEKFNLNLKSFYETIHPDDFGEFQKANEETLMTGADLSFKHRIILGDGSIKWVKERGKISKDKNGNPIFLEGTVQDINSEKKLEISLDESSKIYKYASKATSDSIWDWDLETDKINWPDGSKNVLGRELNHEANDAKSWKNLIHPDDKDRVLKSVEQAINSTKLNWSEEYRILKTDNSYTFVLDKGFFIRDNNGKAVRMIGAMQDVSERKTLESLLEKSYRLARIGSWEIDVIKGTVYWSDITKEIREADKDFIPDLSLGIEYFKEGFDRNTISMKVKECMESGKPWDEELQIITQKGNLKWIRTIGEAEIINGSCIKIYGSFQDIDDKKKAEQQLQEAYNEKNIILESIGDAFFAVNKNHIVTYWNKKAELVLGWNKNEATGKNISEINKDISEKLHFHFNKIEKDNIPVFQFELFLPDSNRLLEINAYSSHNGLSVYLKDITEQKQAIEKIRLSNERFERVSEASNDAIWDIDLTKNVLFLGSGFGKLWGESYNKEVHGTENWLSHIEISDRERIENLFNDSLRNKEINSVITEFNYVQSNENVIPVIARASVIRDEKGVATRVVGAFSDATLQKEYERSLKILNENLEQSNRQLAISNSELEQFAFITSHDLQEPLRMVTAFLSQLERKYSDIIDEKGKKYIYFAVDGAKRMSQIILDLLEFSKVGRLQDSEEEIDLNNLVNEILPLFKNSIDETNAKIIFEDLPVVNGYKTPLRQVLQNLIGNGLKYKRDESPCITISVEEQKNHWQFSVKDNGIGIKPEYFERIFIVFQRLHNREEYSGTGIGLTIVKKIVETLGGEIRVESEEGKGSIFIFSIKK